MAEYYGQRATAGLIITEGISSLPHGFGYARIPGLFKAVLRKCFKGTFILAGVFNQTSSETALSDGQADLIAFERPFISNSDLLERMKVDVPMNAPDMGKFCTPGEQAMLIIA